MIRSHYSIGWPGQQKSRGGMGGKKTAILGLINYISMF